ncbi:MAG: V-type ATP synthase subunit I [Candidatus Sumerlaeota bacterium]|nr:V-type ATP synthase subunit I [Candidatus Sumerlaeota bacterium]
MTVEKIKKMFVIAPLEHRESILAALQRLGVVQIVDICPEDESGHVEENAFDWSRVKQQNIPERRHIEKAYESVVSSIRFMDNYIPERTGYELLKKGPETVMAEEADKILREFDFEKFVTELNNIEGQVKNLHAKRLTLLTRRENLLPWADLPVPLSYFCRTNHVIIRALSVAVTSVEPFQKAAAAAISELWTAKVSESKKNKYIIVMYHRDSRAIADKIIQDFDVHPAVLPCVDMTPAQLIADIDEKIAAILEETRKIEKRLRDMRDEILRLKVVANHLDNSLLRKKAQEYCGETRATFLVKGWIPEKRITGVEKSLRDVTQDVDISTYEPLEGEDVPIILKNSPLVSPYESVLGIYGNPNYSEPDPTPSMAVFFFIGFGFCLGDGGYGLALALLTGWMIRKLKLAPGVKKFLTMLFISAISAIIFGAITGSWLGNLFTDTSDKPLPSSNFWLKQVLLKLQFINPLGKHIMYFLLASLVVGYIQLFWGVLLKLFDLLLRRRFLDAFFDPFAWLLFAAGVPVGIYRLPLGMSLSITGIALILLFAGRNEKNILLRFGLGFWTVYGIVTGFLSDILSYCRLFALGLASGIMANVINIIAFFLLAIPYIGWLFTIIILVVAHFVFLLINVLGAFIHTTRLQFVEFFPKFYTSGGYRFEPFGLRNTFVEISKDQLGHSNKV